MISKLQRIAFIFLFIFTDQILALKVQSFYGDYDIDTKAIGSPATSLEVLRIEDWKTPDKVLVPYRIGVLLPHIDDQYWLGINYAILDQAKKLGVHIKFYSAGGYNKGGVQRRQLTKNMIKDKVHAVILASVTYDKLDRFIAQLTNIGIPVVGLINDINAPTISGKVLSSYYQSGEKIANKLMKDSSGKDLRIAFLPGPKEASWAQQTYKGFTDTVIKNEKALPIGTFKIVGKLFGEASVAHTGKLLEHILASKKNIDYIIGVPAMVLASKDILKKYKANSPKVKLISTYLTPELYPFLLEEKLSFAATDLMIEQARMSLDFAVRVLNGEKPGDKNGKLPFRVSPNILLVNKKIVEQIPYERLFGKRDFKPILKYVVGDEI